MERANPEFDAFDLTMDQLLSVPHDELKRRMAAYSEEAAKNPNKRGPKPKRKVTPSPSPATKGRKRRLMH